jgi:hypothetical protein
MIFTAAELLREISELHAGAVRFGRYNRLSFVHSIATHALNC